MTNLVLAARALRQDLVRLEQLGGDVEETRQLGALAVELRPGTRSVETALSKRALLEKNGALPAPSERLPVARQQAGRILDRFRAAPKAATLKQGKAWTGLIAELALSSKELDASNAAAWRILRSTAWGVEAPETIESRLAPTSENVAALRTYKALFERFRDAVGSVPEAQDGFDAAARLASELRKIKFDYDVPPAVKTFLEAVPGGAPLELLTPEVVTWLQANKSYGTYRIVAGG